MALEIADMFSVYLDDSADNGAPTIALGGYLASNEGWIEYENRIVEVYRKHQITYFHATNFHQAHDEFKNWTGEQRKLLVQDIFDLAGQVIECGICVSVSKGLGKMFRAASPKLSQVSPYGMAFEIIMSLVSEGDGLPILPKKRPTNFFMEAGSKNNGEFERTFARLSQRSAYSGSLQSLSIIGKHSCKAIQLADFIAFYGRRFAKNIPERASDGAGEVPVALRLAAAKIPHCIQRIGGGVSSDLRNPSQLRIGINRRVWLAPTKEGH